jgi:chitin disaccharide deacetylase
MVGAPAAVDAVARARRMPRLRVGLHLVLVDGHPTLGCTEIPGLVRRDGRFDQNMARAGIRFFFLPQVRLQLASEIGAQFEAFRATGLQLDHVNTHKHIHVHPVVAEMMIEIGRDYGMESVRVPSEPAEALRAAFPEARYAAPFYRPWIGGLQRRLRNAGLFVNDHVFGLAWSGNFDEERWLRLIPHLPEGVTEIYLHPATERTPALAAAMPGYRQEQELAALLSPAVQSRIAASGATLATYSDLATASAKI